jgi:hypothetical protein
MPFGISDKTRRNLDRIREELKKEPLWANELARRVVVKPEMMNYYISKYLHTEVEVFNKMGSNIFLRLKKK